MSKSANRTALQTTGEDPARRPMSIRAGMRRVVGSWGVRLLAVALFVSAVTAVWYTNLFLTEQYTETTRNRAEVRLALYSGNIMSELRRSAIVPQLLARDPVLTGALNSGDFSQSSQRLISYGEEVDISAVVLLDETGRVVAATDRNLLGGSHRNDPQFIEALRSNDTVFTQIKEPTMGIDFSYSQRIESNGATIGVIVVGVDLRQFESRWAGIADAIYVADSEGNIILSTEPRWRGLQENTALSTQEASRAIERVVNATSEWTTLPMDAYLQGEALMRQTARIPFQGWRMTSFTTYASVRERVNGVLALEIMGFAIFLALGFYLVSRRARLASVFFQAESAELRQLNQRLQREIAEREKAEKNLDLAEQTLAQSSKLAALGEMSAAVSHELNQPLAAMKTYLAGAKLLLSRKRSDEAQASFQRIDDLIERMGAITRQLKTYARKGGDPFEPLDIRAALNSALSMMEPQLKRRHVKIDRVIPDTPVMIMADRVRFEQVIVNLFRNALDATKLSADPEIEILLTMGESANLSVRDNGAGIENLDALFEPFYTTKAPGDGVGLGLAISSGIVNDLGGRLTARNSDQGGAVFEVQLPILSTEAAPETAPETAPEAATDVTETVPARKDRDAPEAAE